MSYFCRNTSDVAVERKMETELHYNRRNEGMLWQVLSKNSIMKLTLQMKLKKVKCNLNKK